MAKADTDPNSTGNFDFSACVDDEVLFRYLEGNARAEERDLVEKHLRHCTVCSEIVAAVNLSEQKPVTQAEKAEAAQSIRMSADQQVARILTYHKALNPPRKGKPGREGVWQGIFERLTKIVSDLMTGVLAAPAPVRVAVIAALVLLLLVPPGLDFYKSDFQVWRVQGTLVKHYRGHIESARLSGGYGSSGISTILGPEESDYISAAQERLLNALQHDPELQQARMLLAQTFIMQQNFTAAESLFQTLQNAALKSSIFLNDLGVLYSREGRWEKAADSFAAALAADSTHLEALYNLALAQANLDRPQEAVVLLKQYLAREKNQEWRDAAQRLRRKIEQTRE